MKKLKKSRTFTENTLALAESVLKLLLIVIILALSPIHFTLMQTCK